MNILRSIRYRVLQHQQERCFQAFNDPSRGIRLGVQEAGRDSDGDAFIVLRPLVQIEKPGMFLSYVKARLFSLMPSAVAPLDVSDRARRFTLRQNPSSQIIACDGREFPEAAWFIECGGNCIGPLGFRHGVWRDESRDFLFYLCLTNRPVWIDAAAIDLCNSVAGQIVQSYRDKLRHIDI